MLAKVPQLKVVARTSVFQFKEKGGDIREIGRKLGVTNIVEGSVRRDGPQVRITAQLMRVADGFHIWSETTTANWRACSRCRTRSRAASPTRSSFR